MRLSFAALPALFAVPALSLSLSAAQAQDALPFTYDMFESSVQHIDIATCPPEVAAENRFCRATLYLDAFHIFVFADEGDQPLVDFLSYDASAIDTILKTPIPD